ncbi:MAG: SCO family protein [Anaerolineales bacterium]|nr:SCO family protein [Anaerolineales bacterium]
MDRKITRVGVASLLVIVAAIALNILFVKPASFRGTAYADPVPSAFEFTLTSSEGSPFQLSDNRGKITLLFFGYTYCPDICPTTLAELKLVMELLKSDADEVQVVFISVDPGRDTSEKVQKYVERFNPTFIGLSGTEEELAPIWNSYGVFREVVEGTSETNYIINHTARVILIDKAGNMRLSYGFQTPPEDIAHDIKLLLK